MARVVYCMLLTLLVLPTLLFTLIGGGFFVLAYVLTTEGAPLSVLQRYKPVNDLAVLTLSRVLAPNGRPFMLDTSRHAIVSTLMRHSNILDTRMRDRFVIQVDSDDYWLGSTAHVLASLGWNALVLTSNAERFMEAEDGLETLEHMSPPKPAPVNVTWLRADLVTLTLNEDTRLMETKGRREGEGEGEGEDGEMVDSITVQEYVSLPTIHQLCPHAGLLVSPPTYERAVHIVRGFTEATASSSSSSTPLCSFRYIAIPNGRVSQWQPLLAPHGPLRGYRLLDAASRPGLVVLERVGAVPGGEGVVSNG